MNPERNRKSVVRQSFGQRVRELRKAKKLGQRALAGKVGVSFTYVSRIENENLDFGPYPSEDLICRLAEALDADPAELLILAKKVPEQIKKRIFERFDAFRQLAELDDEGLDRVLADIGSKPRTRRKRP